MQTITTTDSCEGSDEGLGGDSWPRPPTPPTSHALRLQQLLETSGEQWDPKEMDNLRAQVRKTQEMLPSRNASLAYWRNLYVPIYLTQFST